MGKIIKGNFKKQNKPNQNYKEENTKKEAEKKIIDCAFEKVITDLVEENKQLKIGITAWRELHTEEVNENGAYLNKVSEKLKSIQQKVEGVVAENNKLKEENFRITEINNKVMFDFAKTKVLFHKLTCNFNKIPTWIRSLFGAL